MPEYPHYSLQFKWPVVTQGDAQTISVLTVDASASTMWDNQAWSYLHSDREETEPPFLVQDFIHTIQPDAKIVIMLRDPVERYCREIHPHICLYRCRCDFQFWFSCTAYFLLFVQQNVLSWFQLAYNSVSFCSQTLFRLPVLQDGQQVRRGLPSEGRRVFTVVSVLPVWEVTSFLRIRHQPLQRHAG